MKENTHQDARTFTHNKVAQEGAYGCSHIFGMQFRPTDGLSHWQGACMHTVLRMRFAPVIEEAVFTRLTGRFGLPSRWQALHFHGDSHWSLVHQRPVITVKDWQEYASGRLYSGSDASEPQDPIPLLRQFIDLQESAQHLMVVSCTIGEANAYVEMVHRHSDPVRGAAFALAVVDQKGRVRGVAIVGRPCAIGLDAGKERKKRRRVLEVRRVATDGARNACSMLYAAARQTAKIWGYERIISYSLMDESGASLRGDGWQIEAESGGQQWDGSRDRVRKDIYTRPKYRWGYVLRAQRPFEEIIFPSFASKFAAPLFEDGAFL